ncbi:MAG: formylmethanofuran dehydrogenase subunit C [Candidatus Methanofastidiosia archaeon]|jgi:formylmethanofuran dehydrogenase subunit C
MQLKPAIKTTIPVTAECISPDVFAGKSVKDIKTLPVHHGNKEKQLKDIFDITDDGSDTIVITGDVPFVKYIGKGMTTGSIVVKGNCGMHTGAQMKGGTLTIKGNVSDWAGAQMKGGELFIEGNAGHGLGGAYRGNKSGMNKGLIVVKGNCGNEVGSLMKRGIIVIEGNTGATAGIGMKGGTIFCYGKAGERPGALMQRGTLVLYNEPEFLPTFTYNAVYNPTWLRVFLKDLQNTPYTIPVKPEHITGVYKRYNGDISELGKGEIFVYSP